MGVRARVDVQVSFLGRKPSGSGTYDAACYRFPDGACEKASFFGLALCRWLTPGRMVVLGTASSMWHALLEMAEAGAGREELWLELEAAGREGMTPALLERLEAALRAAGQPMTLRLIPLGVSREEQAAILQTMAAHVRPRETVALDVTHGLRHLPMVGLTSALHLRSVRAAQVRGLYYGALDLTNREDGVTPVVELDGLLHIADWTQAVARCEAGGDYGTLGPVLERDGVPPETVRALRRASFSEATLQYGAAKRDLERVGRAAQAGLPGAGSLFEGRLRELFGWTQGATLLDYQTGLAERALKRRDYGRTAVLQFEAFVTSLLGPGERSDSFEARRRAQDEFFNGLRGPQERLTDAKLLRGLRNALAHANPDDARGEVRRLLENEQELADTLRRLQGNLLGGSPERGRV